MSHPNIHAAWGVEYRTTVYDVDSSPSTSKHHNDIKCQMATLYQWKRSSPILENNERSDEEETLTAPALNESTPDDSHDPSPRGSHHYRHSFNFQHKHPWKQSATRLERKLKGRMVTERNHSLPHLQVLPPCSRSSSVENIQSIPATPVQRFSHGDVFVKYKLVSLILFDTTEPFLHESDSHLHTFHHCSESMTMIISAFYAKLLIVLGVALPVTSVLQNELTTSLICDIFTTCMYFTSVLFLAYTFHVLRNNDKQRSKGLQGELHKKRNRYGSFYLHMGIAGFSVGSIIYSCLQLGEYFDLSGSCQIFIILLKPLCRICFTVAQTVFIFSYTNSSLEHLRGSILNRFGLMHMIATNACEWLNVIIQETRDDIVSVAYGQIPMSTRFSIKPNSEILYIGNSISMEKMNDTSEFLYMGKTCNVSNMIIPLLRSANPYLRPCGVEYSLLCCIIIVIIWKDICTVPGIQTRKRNLQELRQQLINASSPFYNKSASQFSVDCASAHKGLFSGIGALAGTIVSLILFFGLMDNPRHVETALLQINVWETILFIVTAVGSGWCLYTIREISSRTGHSSLQLEHVVLLVTQCGVYLYYLFQIIGAGFMIDELHEKRRATRILSPICALIQSSFQTLLILDAWSRRCTGEQINKKPGRQLITFLLVSNFGLWLLNRAKNSRAEFHPVQMEFYGVWAWALITHVSVPLLVCYRFQATVCFYEIWKNAYKSKKNEDNFELTEDADFFNKNHIS